MEVKEGFLCPICLKDLKSPTNLSTHFEDTHQEDKQAIKQIRSVFQKTKRKVLNNKSRPHQETTETELKGGGQPTTFVSKGTPETGGIDVSLWETQKEGKTTCLTRIFQETRKNTIERQVIELNKILIRLEKLIKSGIYQSDSNLSNVVKARKNLEKQIVPWESDKEVPFCPHCSSKFSLTYRRHHCRLCGKVTCEQCVDTLDLELTEALIKTDKSLLPRNPEDFLKTCIHCRKALHRHKKLCEAKVTNTVILQLYEKMKSSMMEAEHIQPKFLKMADSINSGETEYGLEVVMETRFKLLKAYEAVETISKRIKFLNSGQETSSRVQSQKLQNSIRVYASNYLTENMFTLPGLPTQDKHAETVKKRNTERERTCKEIADAKQASIENSRRQTQAAMELSRKKNQDEVGNSRRHTSKNNANIKPKIISQPPDENPLKASQQKQPNGVRKEGWGPVSSPSVAKDETMDPVLEQIEIIRGYIEQAHKENRLEEIEMLQSNLKDLQEMYDIRQWEALG